MNEDIERILQKMDWRKIETIMEHLKWYWRGEDQIPSRTDLIRNGRQLLMDANDHKANFARVSTGGFVASKQTYDNSTVLQLDFVIETQFEDIRKRTNND